MVSASMRPAASISQFLRGSTRSPMSSSRTASAFSASSRVIRRTARVAGFIVVSHSSSASISPRPLNRGIGVTTCLPAFCSRATTLVISTSV